MARIYRDALGVPHVRATSVADLGHGQGLATARDRAWQLEHLRRRALGETAAVLGPTALAWDTLVRRADLPGLARRAYAGLGEETRTLLTAYAAGVSAGLAEPAAARAPELVHLGIVPAPWEPWHPVATFLAQHLLFASFGSKLWTHRLRAALGPDAEALLRHEGPETSGSNAWAVGGARTRSGMPLIGGDPHRTIEAPGVYAQVRLAVDGPDGFDVLGLAFPGVPGAPHFAHTGPVAHAITNAMADYQDLYAEDLRRLGDGRVEARGPEGWEPVEQRWEQVGVRRGAVVEPATVEVLVTARGPVVHAGPDTADQLGGALSLRTASWAAGACGLDALVPLLRARSIEDVEAALACWVEPVNNVVVADTQGASGRVRYLVAGLVPTRAEGNRHGLADPTDPATAWSGWLTDLPRHDIPADGQVVTANERRGPESDPVGTDFAPAHRARRIHQLLEGRRDLDVAAFAAVHRDTLLLSAPVFGDAVRRAVAAHPPSSGGAAVAAQVLAWDGHVDAASGGAAAFAAWRGALVRRIAADPALAVLAEPAGAAAYGPVLAPWQSLPHRVGLGLEHLLAAAAAGERPFGLDLDALASAALDDAAEHARTWGTTHVLTPVHGFEVGGLTPAPGTDGAWPVPGALRPLDGDVDTVRCTGSVPGVTDESWRGSVARYAWDLADRRASAWVVPFGASGDPASPHHADQLEHWLEGRLVPVETDWERLGEETP